MIRMTRCRTMTVGIGFNGAETNCGIAHIFGILLMNSYNTETFFSNYYNLQSVHFEYMGSTTVLKSQTFLLLASERHYVTSTQRIQTFTQRIGFKIKHEKKV